MTLVALPPVLHATVLSGDETLQVWLPEMLGGHGFVTRGVSTPGELYRAVVAEPEGICILDATRDDEHMLAIIARLRSASAVGIVALTEPARADVRINALLIGADACLVTPVEPRELAAIMLGVARRAGCSRMLEGVPAAAAADMLTIDAVPTQMEAAAWQLCDDDWVLMSPEGVSLNLSPSERGLIAALVDHRGRVLSREYLTALLDRRGTGPALGGADASSGHRISMLVSRMRKKAAQVGMRLPLRVVRGQGYELSEIARRV